MLFRSEARTLRERWAAVVFIPDVLDLVKRGPGVRRVAMDRAIEGAWPRYDEHERAYRQTMEQRNAVLRRVRRREGDVGELDPWDAQLAEHGALIGEARERLIEPLTGEAVRHGNQPLAHAGRPVTIAVR